MKARLFLCPLLFFVCTLFVFPDEAELVDKEPAVEEPGVKETGGETGYVVAHAVIAGGETLLSNGVLMLYTAINFNLTGNNSWSIPLFDDISKNLTVPWIWEPYDGFIVNQIGHPYQGAVYFNAGRVNGFGFYESILFSAFGSFVWEVFGETNDPSINDMITTITGSLSIGEIFYRLYLEACSAGVPSPLAFFINPMAGLHRLITAWEPPDHGRNLYQFQTSLGTGFGHPSSFGEGFSFGKPFLDIGLLAVYGNPFEQESKAPFDHFELAAIFGWNWNDYMDFRVISDAYLFSFSPVRTDTDMMSTGLSLQFDYMGMGEYQWVDTPAVTQFSNALDWTLKYQHLFPGGQTFQAKAHCGFTFLGVSKYYASEWDAKLYYGGGVNAKLFLNFEDRKLGKLETNVSGYALWTYPETSAIENGNVFWLFANVTYSHIIYKKMSLGLAWSTAAEWGSFGNFSDSRKNANVFKIFTAWNW